MGKFCLICLEIIAIVCSFFVLFRKEIYEKLTEVFRHLVKYRSCWKLLEAKRMFSLLSHGKINLERVKLLCDGLTG